ncbi:MAG: hypothetical protein ACK5FE_07545 [Cyanobacteriota bacterium]
MPLHLRPGRWLPLVLLALAAGAPAGFSAPLQGSGTNQADASLNQGFEGICAGLARINTDLQTSAAPGTPTGLLTQQKLAISPAQYQALWALLKLTPGQACAALY